MEYKQEGKGKKKEEWKGCGEEKKIRSRINPFPLMGKGKILEY